MTESRKPLRTLGPRLPIVDTSAASAVERIVAPIYHSPEWRSLLDRLIAERGRRCEECGRRGCRIFGDHVRELKDGGPPLNPGNVRLLCGACHSRKTIAERSRRFADRPARQD